LSISKNGVELLTLSQWERHAGPKSSNQWVDGRSAKESARAWLEGGGKSLPPEVAAALAENVNFGPVLSWRAEPEARLRFDAFAGEPRNSDLAVYAADAQGSFLLAVEAKADEPFGKTVADTLGDAVDRYAANNRSKGIPRVLQLLSAFHGPRRNRNDELMAVRYQLLTACAGALCEAERHGFTRALMLVHEFVTDKTADRQHLRNANDLNSFLSCLSHGAVTGLGDEKICGPFVVHGAPLLTRPVRLFIGKVTRNIRTS
jgi:hypothetical protein